MTDPYTPEEMDDLAAEMAWAHMPKAAARVRATVQALADARLVILECLNTDVAGELTEEAHEAAMSWLYPGAPGPSGPHQQDPRWDLYNAERKARGG